MRIYTQHEKVDMLLTYRKYRKNSTEAANLLAERYPGRQHMDDYYFNKLVQKFPS